jgi:hypothetical protein
MPLQKVLFKPGVNKENTRYTNEGGWYDCDKIRFRQGTPEKIGGWSRISSYTYEGTCRSLWSWATLAGVSYIGVGTHLKFYIEQGGAYNDVTPIRVYKPALSGPFTAYPPRNFTVTIAAPAVLTFTSAVTDGMKVVLSTTGALPTGLVAGQTYYVVGTSGLTCELSLTYGGQAINTSGTQSGTHSLTSNNVNVTSSNHGCATGDFVTFLGASSLSTQTFTRSTTTQFTLSTALAASTPVVLSVSTGGSLPTGLVAGVVYYINVVSGTTVTFALSPNGAPVVTSSAGSGTFSLYVNSGMTADILNQTYQVTVTGVSTYLIYASVSATAYDTNTGGTVNAAYEIPVGSETEQPLVGWGAGGWGKGSWGTGQSGAKTLRLWYQNNFGQDLIYGYRGGPIYYWNALVGPSPSKFTVVIATNTFTLVSGSLTVGSAVALTSTGTLPTGLTIGTVYFATNVSGSAFQLASTYANAIAASPTIITLSGTQSGTHYLAPNGIPVSALGGASNVPAYANFVMVSDASRFTIAFGCSVYGATDATIDPMLIRWTDQESVVNWTPAATNQAGYVRLSHGSQILTAVQTRQEIVVFTDTSLYSLQYLGPPYVWGSQLLADNVSIAGYNTAIVASGVIYWMGVDKFYKYDGRTQTLRCDLRQFIYGDINLVQQAQFFAGTNEGFNEVWWFYCTADSAVLDRYVVYNYVEDVWYYGSMGRTAWLDSGLTNYPVASTYYNNLVYHEYGIDDNATSTTLPIEAYITSSQYDIGDGHNFGFVWRIVPDLTFRGSSTTGETPQVTMYLLPLQNSGSGYNDPVESGNQSVGGVSYANVDRVGTYTVDQFTGQIYTRVRGRQMSLKILSNQIGTAWQLGAPRIDIRPDGRR